MAYSFANVSAVLTGLGGSIQLGNGSGAAEEGITVSQTNDSDDMMVGADGSVMHSLIVARAGTVTVRLLKTSPVNAKLQAMLDAQKQSLKDWGQNIITISDSSTGDKITCAQVAFKKTPDQTFASKGNTNEWIFNCGNISKILGSGLLQQVGTLFGAVI